MYMVLVQQSDMSFLQFASTLNSNPPFTAALEFDAVIRYIDLVWCLKHTMAPPGGVVSP